MVIPSVSSPHFVSVTPSMDVLFPLLSRIEVSTIWSSKKRVHMEGPMVPAAYIAKVVFDHLPMHLSGSARAISGSSQRDLVDIQNNVWVW